MFFLRSGIGPLRPHWLRRVPLWPRPNGIPGSGKSADIRAVILDVIGQPLSWRAALSSLRKAH